MTRGEVPQGFQEGVHWLIALQQGVAVFGRFCIGQAPGPFCKAPSHFPCEASHVESVLDLPSKIASSVTPIPYRMCGATNPRSPKGSTNKARFCQDRRVGAPEDYISWMQMMEVLGACV